MTSSFDRLSMTERMVFAVLIAGMIAFSFPAYASAQTPSKTLVFEIKNFQTVKIPDVTAISQNTSQDDNQEFSPAVGVINPSPIPSPAPVAVAAPKKAVAAKAVSNNVPPKATDKVYMHEPDLKGYLCPKLGNDKCRIFIAVLKAENGTHECTRDNRGLNKNGSIDIGLAQINWSPKSPYTFEQLQDCKFNLDVAISMYERRGFQPWYAYTKGAYKKHLAAVTID